MNNTQTPEQHPIERGDLVVVIGPSISGSTDIAAIGRIYRVGSADGRIGIPTVWGTCWFEPSSIRRATGEEMDTYNEWAVRLEWPRVNSADL